MWRQFLLKMMCWISYTPIKRISYKDLKIIVKNFKMPPFTLDTINQLFISFKRFMRKRFWNVSKRNIRSVGKQAETSLVQMLGYMVIINITTDGIFYFSSLTCWGKITQQELTIKKVESHLNLRLWLTVACYTRSTSRKKNAGLRWQEWNSADSQLLFLLRIIFLTASSYKSESTLLSVESAEDQHWWSSYKH